MVSRTRRNFVDVHNTSRHNPALTGAENDDRHRAMGGAALPAAGTLSATQCRLPGHSNPTPSPSSTPTTESASTVTQVGAAPSDGFAIAPHVRSPITARGHPASTERAL